ncbi:protease modulator HflC [Candidatus Altiarchaeota archaeon]
MTGKRYHKVGGEKSALIVLSVIIAFIASMMFFVVDETENVIITQFGRPVKIIKEPGLYFKLPEPLQTIRRLDDRIIVSESAESEVLTSDKKNLVIDYYIVWKIDDPLMFVQTVVNENAANFRISDIVYSELRQQLGLYEFKYVISEKRELVNEKVMKASQDKISEYGIRIIDVKIRRINFPYQNLAHVYDRMRSERKMIANTYRSEGEETALRIRAETDQNKSTILAQAMNNATIITGQADAEATRIFGQMYEKDPEFFKFMRTLKAYKQMIPGKDNMLILSARSELFQGLNEKT